MWSCDQNLVALAFLQEKPPWSQFYKDLTTKIVFFEEWFKFNKLGLTLDTNLKFDTSFAKDLKLKFRNSWGLISTFVEVTEEKLIKGAWCFFASSPVLNGIKDMLFWSCWITFNHVQQLYKSKYFSWYLENAGHLLDSQKRCQANNQQLQASTTVTNLWENIWKINFQLFIWICWKKTLLSVHHLVFSLKIHV